MRKDIVLAIAILFSIPIANAQELSKSDKTLFKEADNYFNDENFLVALPIFKDLADKYPSNFEINYYTGACFLNTRYQKDKAIPYLVKAVEMAESTIPPMVHKDLGDLYHLTYDFTKAKHHYQQYLNLARKGENEYKTYCEHMIVVCDNAKKLVADTISSNIENIGTPINTDNSEYAPYVSADDSILFFTQRKFYTDEELLTTENPDTASHLYMAVKQNDSWGTPQKITINGIDENSNVSMAGLSPDGEFIYINASINGQQDILEGRYLNNGSLDLKPMPEPINSEFWEGKVTLSADGSVIYFASSRPGGYGGKDIFRSEKDANGIWQTPQPLGDEVNTPFDEDSPFMHPSGKVFYFSSNGHNSMGRFDIFSVVMSDNMIFPAENLGFPINSTSDDMYFALASDGRYGYLSSSYGNKYGNYDIYKVEMNMNIPITIVKGTILAGNPAIPVPTKIRVIDNTTGKKLRYAYNPNPKTGRYLMIFPPGKDYTMVVEAEGYLPQNIIIQIPDQIKFYELFQAITLNKIVSLGKQVGEQVQVNNSFDETNKSDTVNKDYDTLFDLIENIMASTDSIATIKSKVEEQPAENKDDKAISDLFNMIDEAFAHGDTTKLNEIKDKTIIPDKFEQVFLYSENNNTIALDTMIVGNDTILTTPGMYAFDEKVIHKANRNDIIGIALTDTLPQQKTIQVKKEFVVTPAMIKKSDPNDRRTILNHAIYFDYNMTEAGDSVSQQLSDIAELIVNNKNLGFIVAGYSDNSGNSDYNFKLSQQRALWILEKLMELGAPTNRSILEFHGEDSANNKSIVAEDRRVNITIFELITDKNAQL